MKKATLNALVTYFDANPTAIDSEVIADLHNEIERNAARANKRASAQHEQKVVLYESVKPIILGAIEDEPLTAKEIFTKVASQLPEDFTPAKVQSALLKFYNEEVKVIDNGRNSNTYQRIK